MMPQGSVGIAGSPPPAAARHATSVALIVPVRVGEAVMPDRDAAITPEQELVSLRKLYGAKFNAITAACGYVTEGIRHIEDDNTEAGLNMLREAERILVDA